MAQAHAELSEPSSRHRRAIPAWLMSLVVHLVLLLVLALTVRAIQPQTPHEPVRAAGIVLAHSDTDHQVRYLDNGETNKQPQGQLANEFSEPVLPDKPPSVLDLPLPGDADTRTVTNPNNLIVVPGIAAHRRDPILPGVGDDAILAEEAARQKSRVPGGPPTTVKLFNGPPAAGRNFVFVIDRSKSMGSDGLDALAAAENELFAALRGLKEHHTFQILAYHHMPMYVGSPKMLPASDENKDKVPAFFGRMAAYGGTAHQTALLAALRLKPDVIFLLTDGGHPPLNQFELDLIARRAKGRTAIHCIQFGFGDLRENDNFMQKLARQNRGSYGYVDMSKR